MNFLAKVCEDHINVDGLSYFMVTERIIDAETREEAIRIAQERLKPNESLNGVSGISAEQYWKLNNPTKDRFK